MIQWNKLKFTEEELGFMQITVLNSINFVFSEIKHSFKQIQIANEIQLKHNGTPIENIISLVPESPS